MSEDRLETGRIEVVMEMDDDGQRHVSLNHEGLDEVTVYGALTFFADKIRRDIEAGWEDA